MLVEFTIADQSGSNWETVIGTFNGTSTLTRDLVCQSSNAAVFNISPTVALDASACAGLRVTRVSGEQRARSMSERDHVYPSRYRTFTTVCKWPRLCENPGPQI